MQTRFRRHQPVRLLVDADPSYVEYHDEGEPDFQEIPIIKGMKGKINMLLPNGQYHVEIFDAEGKSIAYAPFGEDELEEDEG